jgi:uncharacterized protein YjiK
MPKGLLLTVVIFLLFIICGSVKKESEPNLEKIELCFVEKYKIKVPEPSGLSFTHSGNALWTVSDETGKVYQITFEGEIISSFQIDGEDLEGITIYGDSLLAVVLERTREIVIVDTSGNEIKRTKLNLKGEPNAGPEGITFNSDNNRFYVVNEKNPRLLIELDEDLIELNRKVLRFASDFSGIFYESNEKVLWIISDESKLIAKCDLEGNLKAKTNLKVQQAEGIAVDYDNKKLYVVSDLTEELFVFEIK